MINIQSLQYSIRLALFAAIAICMPLSSAAQERGVAADPVVPTLKSTRQNNPRGTDIVEPAGAWTVILHPDGTRDSTYLGLAKIPDPRRNEVGATVNTDIETSTLIRLGGAWIYDSAGLRATASFNETDRETLLMFRPGPHDDIVSLQGVRPVHRSVGDEIIYDLRDLYHASTLNPVTGGTSGTSEGLPRLALLRMQSTYRGGEAVDLSIVIAPTVTPRPALQAIRFERRDTTILSAHLNYVVNEEVHVESPWTAGVTLESGVGNAEMTTDIPATLRRAPFTSVGTTGAFYLDATISVRSKNSRWALNAFGMSALSQTDISRIGHHQVILRADARFEHGTKFFALMQMSGEMTDKQYQEFDWNSADYAGSASLGIGHRSFGATGYERTRVEIVAGLRMGENRRIELFETRGRSRGVGPQAVVSGEYAQPLGRGFEIRLGSEARAYSIAGRGHRDREFTEQGLQLNVDARVGKSFFGVTTYAGVTSLWLIKDAAFRDGGRYYENRRFLAPGMAIKMYL